MENRVRLEPHLNPFLENKNTHTTCLIDKWSGARVIRPDDKSRSEYEREKYGVGKSEYELNVYPTYCGGPCTLLSGETVQKSYDTAKVTNPGKFTMEGMGSNILPAFLITDQRIGLVVRISMVKSPKIGTLLFEPGLRYSLHRNHKSEIKASKSRCFKWKAYMQSL